ncbi:MAG: hypothetical protein ACRDIV_13320, partial [Ktedonobacteraceae bacterium]
PWVVGRALKDTGRGRRKRPLPTPPHPRPYATTHFSGCFPNNLRVKGGGSAPALAFRNRSSSL